MIEPTTQTALEASKQEQPIKQPAISRRRERINQIKEAYKQLMTNVFKKIFIQLYIYICH